ncbi:porin [Brevibacillus reuszeri]|uniref:Porin n=1 Tax=Brevibacillus reuszeri TaxID=54915 RepID=A0A0K9YKQ0_9BACL|nr:porin [Brevibacillus reuszeri]
MKGEFDLDSSQYKQELRRTLTFKDLVIYGMVFMAPLAPMQVYGAVAQQSFGMVPLVYCIGVIALMFTAFSYSHMSKEFPYAGSVYSYVSRGMNPHVGFIAGWLILADYILCPALLYAFAGVWMAGILPQVPAFVWTLIFVVCNTLINVRGITMTARANLLMFWMQIITLVVFLGFAVKFVLVDGNGMGGLSLAPLFQADHVDFGFIATATSIAVLGFLGFDGISTLAEEARDPVKTVGKATVLSILLSGILFFIQVYMAALIHPKYETLNPDMGFFEIAREAGGPVFYTILILINVIAVGIAVTLNVQSATARVLYSMSRENLLPFAQVLAKIHPKFQTPVNATIFCALLSIVVTFCLSIETLYKFVTFGAITAFMMLNVTIIVYFYGKKKRRGVKGFLIYALTPFIGLLITGYVWSGFDRMTFTVGFAWVLIGVIVGYVKSNGYRKVAPVLKDM